MLVLVSHPPPVYNADEESLSILVTITSGVVAFAVTEGIDVLFAASSAITL